MKKIFFIFFIYILNILYPQWQDTVVVDTQTGLQDFQFQFSDNVIDASGYTVISYFQATFSPVTQTLKAAVSTDFGDTWPTILTVDDTETLGFTVNQRPNIALLNDNTAFIAYQTYNNLNEYKIKIAKIENTTSSFQTLDTIITTHSEYPPRPKIAIKDNFIIVIYAALTNTTAAIKAAISTDGGNTFNLSTIESNSNPSGFWFSDVDVTSDNGTIKALATWSSLELPNDENTKTATYTIAGGWENITTISGTLNPSKSNMPVVTLTSSGKAAILWQELDFATFLKLALSSDFGASWTAPQTIENYNGNNVDTFPEIKMNELGHLALIWQSNASGSRQPKLGLYNDFGSNLIETKTLTGSQLGNQIIPSLDMDPFGNTFFSYSIHQGAGIFNEYMGHYFFSNNDFAIDSPITGQKQFTSAIISQVSVAQDNSSSYIDAINSWSNYTGSAETNLLTKRFDVVNISLSAVGSREELNFFLQKKLRNTILASAVNEVGTYYLYRDASLTNLIQSISTFNQTVTFIENNIKKDEINTYYLTWSDGINTLGPVTITINH